MVRKAMKTASVSGASEEDRAMPGLADGVTEEACQPDCVLMDDPRLSDCAGWAID
jgi:hypothetical protein